jgi:hypothetical protein
LHATAERKPERAKKQQRQSGPLHRQSSEAFHRSICCSNRAEIKALEGNPMIEGGYYGLSAMG